MNRAKWSRFLVAILVLTLSVWALAGCGGSDIASEEGEADETLYIATDVTSDLSMADAVKEYYDKVDTKFGYDLAHELAYSEELSEQLGWRLAGSDPEHACADFLADKMREIGLKKVDQIGVPCDSFEFKDSELTIKGTDIKIEPAAYQVNGTGEAGIDAEIVDCGTGTAEELAEAGDLKGKILLMGVNQKDEAWIDTYIREAYHAKAAALITYSEDGYGQDSDDTVNVQDVCSPDLGVPTGAISKNQAEEIKKAMAEGNTKCHLLIDAIMGDDTGTTYNVVGMIPGQSHDQQIVISGHYDKYWYGFQDDSCAIGLILTVAKAMIDSGYQPQNDIVFVCHGAEEWGTSGSQFDWTTGAWGMVDVAKPEWANKTLAMINCELPAFKVSGNTIGIGAVPELRTLANNLVESGLIITKGKVKFSRKAFDTTTMEDGVAYRWHGIPYFINMFEDEDFVYHKYHTSADDESTYHEPTFQTNINWYGAMAMYIDARPALELDMTQTAKDLKADFDVEIAEKAGVDTEKYLAAVKELRAAAKVHNEAVKKVNDAYEEAFKNEDGETMKKARAEGKKLNKKALATFAQIQDELLMDDDFQIFYGHRSMNNNVTYLKGTIAGLENKNLSWDDEDSAINYAYQINAEHNYGYCYYDIESVDEIVAMYDNANLTKHKDQWGYKKQAPVIYGLGEATRAITEAGDSGDDSKLDYKATIATFQKALDDTLKNIKERCADELNSVHKITKTLN